MYLDINVLNGHKQLKKRTMTMRLTPRNQKEIE